MYFFRFQVRVSAVDIERVAVFGERIQVIAFGITVPVEIKRDLMRESSPRSPPITPNFPNSAS